MTARHVTIIGAGPVGAVAALYLARSGRRRVTVYERHADVRRGSIAAGRSISMTVSDRAWRAFADVGVEEEVRKISLPLKGRMIHKKDGSTVTHAYTGSGHCIYAVSRAQLVRTLVDRAASAPGVDVAFHHRLTNFDPRTGVLELERPGAGEPLRRETDILLAADGIHSTVRPYLFGERAVEYKQTYTSHWYRELDIPRTAGGEYPLDPDYTHVWPRKDRFLIAFPNLDRSFTATLIMPMEGPISFRGLSTLEDWIRLFRADFEDLLPAVKLDFSTLSRPIAPLMSFRCSPWSWRGRYALIGDAAHAVTPFLGQGMCAGLEDCTVLDRLVADHDDDWDRIFESYGGRKVECDALAELAEAHYQELAVDAELPSFVLRKRLEQRLQREHPERFMSIYSIITFSNLPYSRAVERKSIQEALLDRLVAIDDVEVNWSANPAVQGLVREYLARV